MGKRHYAWPLNKARMKGWQDKVKYPLLALDELPMRDKAHIQQQLLMLETGTQANQLSGRDNWSYEILDQRGRCGVLKNRGVEVAVFFKRQLTYIEPAECDPVPELALDDPDEAWMRLDLMGVSSKQLNSRLKKQHQEISHQMVALSEQLDVTEKNNVNLEKEVARLKTELEAAKIQIAKKAHDPGLHRSAGQADVMNEFLPLVTAFVHAQRHSNPQDLKLFNMLWRMITKSYEKFKGMVLAPDVGEKFDPAKHNAVQLDDKKPDGEIAGVASVGLEVDGKVVVAAAVSVGSKK